MSTAKGSTAVSNGKVFCRERRKWRIGRSQEQAERSGRGHVEREKSQDKKLADSFQAEEGKRRILYPSGAWRPGLGGSSPWKKQAGF
jgi:hypothetical protein